MTNDAIPTGVPVPECRHPLLPSAGVRRATKHDFATVEEIPPLIDGHRSWAYLFRCAETGAMRRWGVVSVEAYRVRHVVALPEVN